MEIDPNVAAAEATRLLVRDFFEGIRSAGTHVFSRHIVPFLTSFDHYLSTTFTHCNSVRLITNRDRTFPFESVYVEGRYRHNNAEYSDNDVCHLFRDGGKIVVQGLGGIGKTMLLKHLWLSVFKSPEGRVPLLVELRRMNGISTPHLVTYIRNSIASLGDAVPDDVFRKLMHEGRFLLLLDGFDELNEHIRDALQSEIIELSRSYEKLGIVISSRDSERFFSWPNFQIFQALPFDKPQVIDLITRVEFDDAVKKKFVRDIVELRFDEYKDFLRTPLLVLMMLLTFRQFATISPKRHVFYRHAFTTLYSEHDASKEAFSRERKSGLDEDDFERLFSLFCFYSYIDGSFTFSKSKLMEYVDRAIARSNLSVDRNNFVDEATESVNLLFNEGDYYSFTHRSFQEYFTATAIIGYFPSRIAEIFFRLPNIDTDSVVSLCYEMNIDLVEENFVLPVLLANEAALREFSVPSEDIVQRLTDLNASWVIDSFADGKSTYNNFFIAHAVYRMCTMLSRIYPEAIHRQSPIRVASQKLSQKITHVSKQLRKTCESMGVMEIVFIDMKTSDGWFNSTKTGRIEALPRAMSFIPLDDPSLLAEWTRHLRYMERLFSEALALLPSVKMRHQRRSEDASRLF